MAPAEERLDNELTDGHDIVDPAERLTEPGLVDPVLKRGVHLGRVDQERRGRSRTGNLRPRWARTGEEESLDQVYLRLAQDIELAPGLDPFGDHAGAHFLGEGDNGTQQRPAVGIFVDPPDELAVELQIVRGELHDMAEARVAGPGVVDG